MVNAPGIGDGPPIGIAAEIKTSSKNFTPLSPEFKIAQTPELSTDFSEPRKYETPTMSPQDKEMADKFLEQIMSQGKSNNPQEVISQVQKMPDAVKTNPGFIDKLFNWLFDFFTLGVFKKK